MSFDIERVLLDCIACCLCHALGAPCLTLGVSYSFVRAEPDAALPSSAADQKSANGVVDVTDLLRYTASCLLCLALLRAACCFLLCCLKLFDHCLLLVALLLAACCFLRSACCLLLAACCVLCAVLLCTAISCFGVLPGFCLMHFIHIGMQVMLSV